MKVGILTFHNSANYGAAFQAYATQEGLNNLGVEGEIINYTNSYRRGGYGIKKLFLRELRKGGILTAVKALAGAPLIELRKRRFNKFYRKRLKLSKEEYFNAEQLNTTPPIYDYYLVGSDQVWNYDHNGCDMSYLLDFVSDKNRTLSYASSFGLDSIADELKEDYARLLGSIRALSVREKVGADIVKSLTGRDVPVVLDPVFLLSKKHWQDIAKHTNRIDQPYILLYTTKSTYYDDFLRTTGYNIERWHIAHLTTSPRLKDILDSKTKLVFAASPEEFLGLVENSKLVLTSSFHGTALSIIFHKQFVSFLANNKGKDARITDLLNRLGLKNRIFHNDMTQEQVDKQIDYETVQNKLEDLRKKSLSFLQQAMNLPIKDKQRD